MNPVTINNIDIPFGRLVAIIFKFMLASIPAVLLLYLVLGLISLCFLALFGGIIGSAGLLDSAIPDVSQPDGTSLGESVLGQ